ncbi:hypothetical protein NUW54_g512 [Trametes sanguinea]|uniref:Uncharacterized protein n=1 Tax=Trametes sanguinea TaxID=158606 RepID=A0ACC1Q900_9APHY|nr:hypothetical protein NUW54_g512 [Trametes sanguinea]
MPPRQSIQPASKVGRRTANHARAQQAAVQELGVGVQALTHAGRVSGICAHRPSLSRILPSIVLLVSFHRSHIPPPLIDGASVVPSTEAPFCPSSSMSDIQKITPDPFSQSKTSSSVKIPTLNEDGSNWVLYKAQSLTARLPTLTTTPGVDSDADEKYETALDKWTGNHATIKSLLLQTVPESLKLEIATKPKPMKLGMSSNHQLWYKEGADPRPVLAQLARVHAKYATTGRIMTDSQYKVLILAALPVSYRPAICAIMASARTAGTLITSTALIDAITLSMTSSLPAECWSKGGGKEGQGPKRWWGKGKGKGKEKEKGNDKTTESSLKANGGETVKVAALSTVQASAAMTSCLEDCFLRRFGLPHLDRLLEGASRHFDPCGDNFLSFHTITPIPINSADGQIFYATGEGDVQVSVKHSNNFAQEVDMFVLRNVLYAPSMPISLTSVSRLVSSGFQAKQTRAPFPKERSSPPSTCYGQWVHKDVWGKAQVQTWDGKQYFIMFLDDYSDEVFVSLMRNKSDTFAKYRVYEAWVKVHRGVAAIGELQSDRGGEYLGNDFSAYLESQGTIQRLTVHDPPQQNGKAERLNCTLIKHTRALLFDAKKSSA